MRVSTHPGKRACVALSFLVKRCNAGKNWWRRSLGALETPSPLAPWQVGNPLVNIIPLGTLGTDASSCVKGLVCSLTWVLIRFVVVRACWMGRNSWLYWRGKRERDLWHWRVRGRVMLRGERCSEESGTVRGERDRRCVDGAVSDVVGV